MANDSINTIKLLPEYFRTDKNSKFLSSTLDQLIQPAQLTRVNGYIGSTATATYNTSTDVYISEVLSSRKEFQLTPALVINDSVGNIKSAFNIADVSNEIAAVGGIANDTDRLYRSKIYSYNPKIDWDKLINYRNYYWMPEGTELVTISSSDVINVDQDILGKTHYTFFINDTQSHNPIALSLVNGLRIAFGSGVVPLSYAGGEYIVEGVGTSIRLVDVSLRDSSSTDHDYITINRSSVDVNPWSKFNHWVGEEAIALAATVNNTIPVYVNSERASRPIIEFYPDIQLYNFGSTSVTGVDVIDTTTEFAFRDVEAAPGYYSDGVLLQDGYRVIFNADRNPEVRGNIYKVGYVTINSQQVITLTKVSDYTPAVRDSLSIQTGVQYAGTHWWYNGAEWVYAQQRTSVNQAPLFDLFDDQGNSYSNTSHYITNFTGTQIFGYAVGTGTNDSILGFPLEYQNTALVATYLFNNYFMTDEFVILEGNRESIVYPVSSTYLKIGESFHNVWDAEITTSIANTSGIPLGITNNPLNGSIASFTFSELAEHAATGIKLISNANPISFANFYIANTDHSVISAIETVSDHYNQFKFLFLQQITNLGNQFNIVDLVDTALTNLSIGKNNLDSYYNSDMVAYGATDLPIKSYTVRNSQNKIYPISAAFDLTTLSLRSIMIYLNDVQLVFGRDYYFVANDAAVNILTSLIPGDIIKIREYQTTKGCFVPPTPTKLGLYPKYTPSIFVDNTYQENKTVIQGHDGSITIAYGDYRDTALLELETRIYNNIKSQYRQELFDINSVIPGAFRSTDYSVKEVNQIIESDFIRWAGVFGIDYTNNNYFDQENPFTWNYVNGTSLDFPVNGYWRAVYKYLYDTDRPDNRPWEMLGFGEMPDWWIDTYGPAPYTNGNLVLWNDLEAGRVVKGSTAGINPMYARPGLSQIIPVDDNGNLIPPSAFVHLPAINTNADPFVLGDWGPVETTWRRSSYYPFTLQRLAALTKPADYCSLMYDVSRTNKNIAGQWNYGTNLNFLNPKNSAVPGDGTLTDGYSVFVVESGNLKDTNYRTKLIDNLKYFGYNLFYKVGGFISKSTTQIIIDAYTPTSTDPGAVLADQDYSLFLSISNPVITIGVSGIVIQRSNNGYVVKGYDTLNPYFTVFPVIRNVVTPAITVGGVSESYVVWTPSSTSGSTGLSSVQTTTAHSAPTSNFYQQGQIVRNGNIYYRVTVSHQAEQVFNPAFYAKMEALPVTGGVTVQTVSRFDKSTSTQIPYGTTFNSIQDVYDFILGYGAWLTDQGFNFEYFNNELNATIDWEFSTREFLYWTTQNWSVGSIITLSPFSQQIQFSSSYSVVDNLFDQFYGYSLLKANGQPFPKTSVIVDRSNGVCTITTNNTTEGIYFARLNAVQKEHGIIFNNTTVFGDTIFNPETGSRQLRMKVSGFKTANWNGDFSSPGFVYDLAQIDVWQPHTNYIYGSTVQYNSLYYSAANDIPASDKFTLTAGWILLDKAPTPGLLPNFDYKITQFKDFYSLNIDNFDGGQERAAQHLTGYTPRNTLKNIIVDPIAQYKFYQGYIREKGTQNSITKLAKSAIQDLLGQIDYYEEWAFRLGNYGSFTTYQEIEVTLPEGSLNENPKTISIVDQVPNTPDESINYVPRSSLTIGPMNSTGEIFATIDSADSLILPVAGYVRHDDVDSTAYNRNSILDIANNSLIVNNQTVWVGFTDNGSWDVQAYTLLAASVIGVQVTIPQTQLTFTTNNSHGLSTGDIVSIVNFDTQVNGVYTVTGITSSTQFTVATTLAYLLTAASPETGQLYKFISRRASVLDNIWNDRELLKLPYGSKFWVDDDSTGHWAVYEKTQNYTKTPLHSVNRSANQGFGWAISKRKGNNVIVTSSPIYSGYNNRQGLVFVYDGNTYLFSYELDSPVKFYTSIPTFFGYTLVYDDVNFNNSGYGLIFAGAPRVGGTKSNSSAGGVRYAIEHASPSNYVEEGLVKISSVAPFYLQQVEEYVLLSPNPSSYQKFGSSIFVERNTGTKLVLVGAPGTATTGTGAVYAYTVISTGTDVVIDSTVHTLTPSSNYVGNQWGYAISGSDNASMIAVSSPGTNAHSGFVSVYNRTTLAQTIVGTDYNFSLGSNFGSSISVSPNGQYLFVSATLQTDTSGARGQVAVFVRHNNTYTYSQTLLNPVAGAATSFGNSIDATTNVDQLVISDTDAVYIYTRNINSNRFVLGDKLVPDHAGVGSEFGNALVVDDNVILVGAPAINSTASSVLYKFNKIDQSANSWKALRKQDSLVDLTQFRKTMLVDTFSDDVVNYLDIIDPVKGRIAGLAQEELKYISSYDPAIYSIGTSTVVINTNNNWLDDHVGELWWDLSTVKYYWYEQGEIEYRKNHWGSIFPGASIDVYEWVGSALLPSEWSIQADTALGLASGVSGQPKFPDNTVVSIKQVYNATTNSFNNYYYYWVKNKVILPSVKNRRISSFQVASLIADPINYGQQCMSVLSSSTVNLSNVASSLIDTRINLNIASDVINNSINKHTEWILLQENSPNSYPTALLNKKLIDSLLGHDSLGNPVPDPDLSSRQAYGIEVRPRQGMFVDRIAALRNVIEFTNQILLKTQITGNYSFKHLNLQELPPDKSFGLWDKTVENTADLTNIDTYKLKRAVLSCHVSNGKISSVTIVEPGYGYLIAPTVTVSNGSAEITTEIDESGQVISTTITNAGSAYTTPPVLTVRPFTVIVLVDDTYNGKWSEFTWDYKTNSFDRTHTQAYNTPLYWNYVDWKDPTYSSTVEYTYTINAVYDLFTLPTVGVGQYVKVLNGGDGNYLILKQVDTTQTLGNFDKDFDLVYKQNGTIQISDVVWNLANLNWDPSKVYTYDQTLYNQTPDIELANIITAIKEDIFIGELAVNWNLLFFKSVKYALTEQKVLDWAFKTSFVSMYNNAGSLSQPAVYKLQDSTYYEEYIQEVKPYHTQLRNFTSSYTNLDQSETYATDFDLPAIYNTETSAYEIVGPGVNSNLLTEAPWDDWAENIGTSGTVRTNSITMKFDRYSRGNEIGSSTWTDSWTADGSTSTFRLSWLAQPDKSKIKVTINGNYSLVQDYNINYYSTVTNGLTHNLCDLVLDAMPEVNQIVSISYDKNQELYSAAERILNFYAPSAGMPGQELGQLMEGIEYPGVSVQGLPFNYSAPWGASYSSYGTTEWDDYNSAEPLALDSVIGGGTWGVGTQSGVVSIGALGVNPDDIIVDGDGFFTPTTGYAPEELVAGQTVDALAINVYTSDASSSPIIISGYFPVHLDQVAEYPLSIPVSNIDSLTVTYNDRLMVYTTTDVTMMVDQPVFNMDWSTNSIVIGPQLVPGFAGYSLVSIEPSGDANDIIDTEFVSIDDINTSTGVVVSLAAMNSIGTATVYVNGLGPIPRRPQGYHISNPRDTSIYYELNRAGAKSDRAATFVYNLVQMPYTIVSHFAGLNYTYINQVREQNFTTDGESQLTLLHPLGPVEPVAAQAVVELNTGTGWRMLLPPTVAYYTVSNQLTLTYSISNKPISFSSARVYLNGNILSTSSYTFNSTEVIFNSGAISRGDLIGIVAIPSSNLCDYDVDGSTLTFINVPPVDSQLRVITYSDYDNLLFSANEFTGITSNRIKLPKPILNSNYTWVILNGNPLINLIDYTVLPDQVSIEINQNIQISDSDVIEVLTFNDLGVTPHTLGFRMFNDIFNATSYKRLSSKNSTYLTRPLHFTDTKIYVADPTVLTPPIPSKNIPGVVIIAGERIEFLQMAGDILTNLRRGTYGTSPLSVVGVDTVVIDQSYTQSIPYSDVILTQTIFTNSGTNTYTISPTAYQQAMPTNTGTTISSDGITLSPASRAVDQVLVNYGGRLLNKDSIIYQDTTASFYSPTYNNLTTISTVADLPISSSIGDAYLIAATNQIWVQENSLLTESINGFVYRGLNYLPPEYSINTSTHQITLNVVGGIQQNIKLTISKKEISTATTWSWNDVNVDNTSTTVSLLDSHSVPAVFLQSSPAALPTQYYYGIAPPT